MSERTPDEIFNDALEQSGDARRAYLERVCAGDAELRREVESLLAAFEAEEVSILPPGVPALPPRVGPYAIRDEVGRGSMGIVYLAHDDRLDRLVALKVLPDRLANQPSWLSRFRREGRLLAALNHPNIATIHSLEEAEGRHFLTMEYVEGGTLADHVADGALPPGEALAIGADIARALEAAHARGVVHRDLKPLNIIVKPDGVAKVLDFGLATSIEGDDAPVIGAAGAGDSISGGTPGYMSPEQLRGVGVDARSDIWALGCILYQCFTGRALFPASTAEAMAEAVAEPPDLGELDDVVVAPVRALVARMLAPERDERLADVRVAREVLESAAQTDDRARSRPGRGAIIGTSLVIAVLTFGAFWLWQSREPVERVAHEVPIHRQLTYTGTAMMPAISPDGERLVFVDALAGGREIVSLIGIEGGSARTLLDCRIVTSLAWAPDGEHLLIAGQRTGDPSRRTYLLSITGAPIRSFDVTGHVCWSPDGARFAVVDGEDRLGRLRIVDLEGRVERTITPTDSIRPPIRSVAWSPDGRHLAVTDPGPGGAVLYTVEIENAIWSRASSPGDFSSPLWAPAGDAIYLDDATEHALKRVAIDPATGKRIDEAIAVVAGVRMEDASLSHDGRRLVFARGPSRGNLWTLALDDPDATPVQLTFGAFVHGRARYSPDGTEIVFSRWLDRSRDLFIMPVAGGPPRQLTFDTESHYPVWSPDGRTIAFTMNAGRSHLLCFVPAAGGDHRVDERLALIRSLDWAPGSHVLYQTERRRFWSMDPRTGDTAPIPVPDSSGLHWNARWSPDGRRVAYFASDGPQGTVVEVLTLDDASVRVVYDGVGTPIGWSSDGMYVYLVVSSGLDEGSHPERRGRERSASVAIVLVPVEGGAVAHVRDVPHAVRMWSSMDLAPDRRQVVYMALEFASDIWMIEDFDRTNLAR